MFYHQTTVSLDWAHSLVQEEQAASFLVWTCFLNSAYYNLYLEDFLDRCICVRLVCSSCWFPTTLYLKLPPVSSVLALTGET